MPRACWYRRGRSVVASTAVVCAAIAGCTAGTGVDGDYIRVRLVGEVTTVQPGRPFWVGLVQKLDDGWHTYWRNPGDSGAATRLEWHLDEGWSASEIAWPTPAKLPYGNLVNFGYEDQVLLPVQISPPPGVTRGRHRLVATARWLVCADVCVPGEAELSLTVRVRGRGAEPDHEVAPLFRGARRRLPVPAPGEVRAAEHGDHLSVTLELPRTEQVTSAWFFPHQHGVVVHAAPQESSLTASGAIEVRVLLQGPTPAPRLEGVLVVSTDTGSTGFTVSVPIGARG